MNIDDYLKERQDARERDRREIAFREQKKNRQKMRRRNIITFFAGIALGILVTQIIFLVVEHNRGGVADKNNTSIIISGNKNDSGKAEKADSVGDVALSDAESGTVSDNSSSEESILKNLQQSLMTGEGTLASLRKAFKDQIMITSGNDFYFFPIEDKYKKNNYDIERLTTGEDGLYKYEKEDGSYCRVGVDVSKYQGDIDWEQVKASGIDFAIIRAGIRGYGSGALVMDETFLDNALSASAVGLEIGTYFFSQAVNEEEAIEEANCVIESLSGNEIYYPIVYDLERIKDGRMNGLTASEMTDNCLAFCETVKEAGYRPMIYGNMETFMLMLEFDRIQDIDKWLAYYNDDFYFPYDYSMWQYTESGHVNGIEGEVDLNLDLSSY